MMNSMQQHTSPCPIRDNILVERTITPTPKSRRDDIYRNVAYLRHAVLHGKFCFYQYLIPDGIEINQLNDNIKITNKLYVHHFLK